MFKDETELGGEKLPHRAALYDTSRTPRLVNMSSYKGGGGKGGEC